MSSSVLWFRRDLRLGDNPALLGAADSHPVALFVLDPTLWEPAGPVRRAYLLRSLRRLDHSIGGRLHVRVGDPVEVVGQVASDAGATQVHCAADFGPYGSRRDDAVQRTLVAAGRALVRSGSAYAVAPGRVRKPDGSPYQVFTPFYRAWLAHGWRRPAPAPPPKLAWRSLPGGVVLPDEPTLGALALPEAGEEAALARWAAYLDSGLSDYHQRRDRPDLGATSVLSAALRWGEIHPRTLLADLSDHPGRGAEVFGRQLAWREFYADVLHHRPDSARAALRTDLSTMQVETGPWADAALAAWQRGRTGYPFIDAGMRQLLAEGWMPNRVRMASASFLVKDLHLDWTIGARWFMRWLADADLASNQHGWQWVAGTGTDAAPYHRIFNPVLQGRRFDPDGHYVRRYVPELAHVGGPAVHEPWVLAGGLPPGYPDRLVRHEQERLVALDRYAAATGKPVTAAASPPAAGRRRASSH